MKKLKIYSDTPIAALHRRIDNQMSNDDLKSLASSYQGKSVAEHYRGPGWVNSDGIACLVFVTPSEKWPRLAQKTDSTSCIAWIWNYTSTLFFSLSVYINGEGKIPRVRWFGESDSEIVQAIKEKGLYFAVIADDQGLHSGWFEMVFRNGTAKAPPSKLALSRLFDIPAQGLRGSIVGEKYNYEQVAELTGGEIWNDEVSQRQKPVWKEPESDFWATIACGKVWEDDLDVLDRAKSCWGLVTWNRRRHAASFVQELIENRQYDGSQPVFDQCWQAVLDKNASNELAEIVQRFPAIGNFLQALDGPCISAGDAYVAAYEAVTDSTMLLWLLGKVMESVFSVGNTTFCRAYQETIMCVLMDFRITDSGLNRVWLRNDHSGDMCIEKYSININDSTDDLRRYWTDGFDVQHMIDSGYYLTASDYPMKMDEAGKSLREVKLNGEIDDVDAVARTFLAEALQARQWSIPWGARIEVNIGPFVSMKIFEKDGEFECLLLDASDYYYHVSIGMNTPPPRICSPTIYQKNEVGEIVQNEEAACALRLIAASIVRDFVVVEERERVFSSRSFRKRIRGRDIRTIIYLPRVKYSTPSIERVPREEGEAAIVRHTVKNHLRKANNASAEQRFLAQRYGIHVPEGFTFVRAHERGSKAQQERVVVYRSRSASQMIFNQLDNAPVGTRPAWFDFEKDCARFLSRRGLRVVHQSIARDGDGGVDLFAVDSGGGAYLVQCKCWSLHRQVGPEVVRELVGAIALASKGSDTPARGVIITTSHFTEGSMQAATELGIELIDGYTFAKAIDAQD